MATDLEKYTYIGVFIALIITSVGFIQADFGNEYGFTNQTNNAFSDLIDYDEYNETIKTIREQTSSNDADPGLLGTLIDYGQFIFSGGYQVFKTLLGLPNLFDKVVSQSFTLFGLPIELRGYFYAFITLALIFAVLSASGVLKK